MRKGLILLLMLQLLCTAASCAQIVGDIPQQTKDVYMPDGDKVNVEVWVEKLDIPWSLVFLPDGRALISERPGRIRLVRNRRLDPEPYVKIEVAHIGEGGLMGLAVHPEFPKEPYIYAMLTYRTGDKLYNRVARFRDQGSTATFDRVIIDAIPGGRFHNGGRIEFGPDGMLYVTAGETFDADLAQDLKSLGGKILRVTPEGRIPPDNPIKDSLIYSYGHRNPQGLAWQPGTGALFSSEHGPSGEFGRFGHDEINIIRKGGNYGWPKVIGAAGKKEYEDPLAVWKDATPPSGITFYRGRLFPYLKGDLFVATLRSEALIRIRLDKAGSKVMGIERWFTNEKGDSRYGRIRDVVEGPDGALYFLTNNTDGRGNPRPGDDKIFRILPAK